MNELRHSLGLGAKNMVSPHTGHFSRYVVDGSPPSNPSSKQGRQKMCSHITSQDGNSGEDEEMSNMKEDVEEDPEWWEGSDEGEDEDEEDGEIARVPSDGKSDNGEEGDHL